MINNYIIKDYFNRYLNQINNFQNEINNKNEIMGENTNISFEQIEELKSDLKLNPESMHFINAYYLNILKNVFLELVNIFPELVICNKYHNDKKSIEKYFRRNIFLNLLHNKGKYIKDFNFETKNKNYDDKSKLYEKLEIIIKYFIDNSLYSKEKFLKYIYPFILNNGYFYLKLDKFYEFIPDELFKIKLFIDISLNNYSLLNNLGKNEKINEIINNNNDYRLYYLSYILRIGITNFIIYKNDITLQNNLSFDFYHLYRLRNMIWILRYNSKIIFENLNQDIIIFINYLLNKENDKITMERNDKVDELLDIGSTLSLFLITIYFNYNYEIGINFDKESLHELLLNLFKLSNIICSQNYLESISYNKKLILFSLFSVFNIFPFPFNDKILNKNVFKLYNYINGCLLNYNSILYSNNFFNVESKFQARDFDIYSDGNNDIFTENYMKIFNIEGNNIIINYNIATTLFRLILTGLIQISTEKFFKELESSTSSFNIFENNEISKDSAILFYYNCLNFYFIKNKDEPRKNSATNFIEIINSNFYHSSFLFPKMKNENNYAKFFLNDYLKCLLLCDKLDYNVLYSFLLNIDRKRNNVNFNLLIFLLKEKWNISFQNEMQNPFNYDSRYYYGKLLICLEHIKTGKNNIFISLIILRRIFPEIILLIDHYLKNHNINKNDFIKKEYIINGKIINILTHEFEDIWDENKNINILEELINNKNNQKIVGQIISYYFLALSRTMKIFSEFGFDFRNAKSLWNQNDSSIKMINYKGRGKYKNKIKFREIKSKRCYNNLYIGTKNRKIKECLIKIMYKKKIGNKIEENKKKGDNPKKEGSEKIKENGEQIANKEEEKKENEDNQKIITKNIVFHFNQLFYETSINKAIGKRRKYPIQDIIGLFENDYKKNYKELNTIDNEYYFLFEVTFYCMYLNLIKIYYQNKDKIKDEETFIFDSIEKFLINYETYSLYINFIEEEGVKTFIKRKYDELFDNLPSYIKLYPKTYMTIPKLRKYLLKNKIFKNYNNEYINIIEKKKLIL